MKTFHIRFCKRKIDGIMSEIVNDHISSLPDKAGVFILGTADGTNLVYPWGTSPIFYIGRTNNLYKWLKRFRESIKTAQQNPEDFWGYPRYQYSTAFGASLVWFAENGDNDARLFESEVIYSFYDFYGAIPVANGVWPSGIKKADS
jgi:hypothetical protein